VDIRYENDKDDVENDVEITPPLAERIPLVGDERADHWVVQEFYSVVLQLECP
jgi:hypothetical protein